MLAFASSYAPLSRRAATTCRIASRLSSAPGLNSPALFDESDALSGAGGGKNAASGGAAASPYRGVVPAAGGKWRARITARSVQSRLT